MTYPAVVLHLEGNMWNFKKQTNSHTNTVLSVSILLPSKPKHMFREY